MEEKEYDDNCKKMQEKMIGIANALLTKVKDTTSPIDYLVTIKKLEDMIANYADGFAILANIEFKKLQESTVDGDEIIKSGAIIKKANDSFIYEYPEYFTIMEDFVKASRISAKNDGTAKKGKRRNKRDFTISLPK